MAQFIAAVPLNISWRHAPTGTVVEIVQDGRNGVPWPAGVAFEVPDAVADAFEADMADPAPEVPPRRYWAALTGDHWEAPDPQPRPGVIPGLTRVS